MNLKITVKAAVPVLFFSLLLLLSACGELNTSLFPPGGNYQVRALVNNSSLESSSIIRQGDKITPYFSVSVEGDPDLTGLMVYLQNSKGDIVGERVLYSINPMDEAIQPETQQEDKDSKDKEGENETAEQTEDGLPKQATEKQVSVDTKSAAKKYDTLIRIKSFDPEKMPPFPLPKNLEVGSYSMVFKALGISNTLSLTEVDIFYLGSLEFRLKDISVCLPWFSDTRLIPPGATVMLKADLDFDSSLNPYVVWYNGRNIIGEGALNEGAGNILWKAPEQSGFYSLRIEVFPFPLKRKSTGVFRELTLPVSAKASQTSYFAAELTANVNRAATASAPSENFELLRWYRFDGNLNEANPIPDRMFEPANKRNPRWAAVGQSYGLSAGPDDNYFLQPIRFFRAGQNQGGGIFLFNIRPVAEGTILSAFFPTPASVGAPVSANALAEASDGVWMDVAMRENAIMLRLKTKAASIELPVIYDFSMEQGFIPIAVDFYIRPDRFEAKLRLGEDNSLQSMTGEIRLSSALAGEGRIRLGVDNTAPDHAAKTRNALEPDLEMTVAASIAGDIPVNTVQSANTAASTIWDEFAVLYSSPPALSSPMALSDEFFPE